MVIFREHVLSEKPTVPVTVNIAVDICWENATGRSPVQVYRIPRVKGLFPRRWELLNLCIPQHFVEFRLEDVIKGTMTGRATEEQIDCAAIPTCRLVNNVRFLQPESPFAT